MKNRLLALTFLSLTMISGCSSLGLAEQKEAKIKKITANGELLMASIPAQLRGVYIRNESSANTYTSCAEPFSDVAASSSAQASLEATNKLNAILNSQASSTSAEGSTRSMSAGSNQDLQQTANGAIDFVSTIVTLDGRTQYVLLAREMMFRTCEAASNGWLGNNKAETATNVKSEHEAIIAALTSMVAAEQQKAKAQSDQALASVANKVAAGQLDSEILKHMSSASSIASDSLSKQLVRCIESAKDDKSKSDCAKNYASQMKGL
ncbi:hypothetical protein [Pseudomonas crudilactis]|uniref:hypothetical protein n=1 Tax=Pseudomonas crudilactis TaxID=2697028 RepID=UPI0015DB0C0E|nr:hypothetical protein [Pseudomonas crudilactis]